MQIEYRLLRLAAFLTAALAGSERAISLFAAENGPKDAEIEAWTDERVSSWQPTAAERRFDEIGWADSLMGARKLSTQSGRPVFLFTLDGRIAIGRC